MTKIDPIGEVIEKRFRVIAALGEGGFASVYRAEQLGMEREVAIKFMNLDALGDDEVLERFKREAKILASLKHKNIVQCYAYGLWQNKLPYLVLELLQGESLSKQLAREGRIRWTDAFQYGIEICAALSELHKHDIIHRDLKPDNIMICSDGRVRIIDFGLASVSGQRLTQTGMLVGSLFYLSPEQATASDIGSASDIYSLGCILYHIIAGVQPFYGDVPVEVLYKHVNEEAAPLSTHTQDIPLSVERIIAKAMNKSAGKRFATADDFAAAMAAVIQQETAPVAAVAAAAEPAVVAPEPRARRKRVVVASCVAAALVLVGLALIPRFMQWYQASQLEALRAHYDQAIADTNLATPLAQQSILENESPVACWAQQKQCTGYDQLSPADKERYALPIRAAALRDALSLSKQLKLTPNEEATLLLAQSSGWFLSMLPFDFEAMEAWYQQAETLVSQHKHDINFDLYRALCHRNGLIRMKMVTCLPESKVWAEINSNVLNSSGQTNIPRERVRGLESALGVMFWEFAFEKKRGADHLNAVNYYLQLLSGTGRGADAAVVADDLATRLERAKTSKQSVLAAGGPAEEPYSGAIPAISALNDLAAIGDVNATNYDSAWHRIKKLRAVARASYGNARKFGVVPLKLLLKREDYHINDTELSALLSQETDPEFKDVSVYWPPYLRRARQAIYQGSYDGALAELKTPSSDPIEEFWRQHLRALALYAQNKVKEGHDAMHESSVLYRSWKQPVDDRLTMAYGNAEDWYKRLARLNELSNSGGKYSHEACELRGSGTGPFTPYDAVIESRLLVNLDAAKNNTRENVTARNVQAYGRLCDFYTKTNQPAKLVALAKGYRDQTVRLAAMQDEKSRLRGSWYLLNCDAMLAKAYLDLHQNREALTYASDSIRKALESTFPPAVPPYGVQPFDYLYTAARVCQMSAASEKAETASLASNIVRLCQKYPFGSGGLEMRVKVATLLSDGGFENQADPLFVSCERESESPLDLPVLMEVARAHCFAMKQAHRDSEAWQLARKYGAYCSDVHNPLVAIKLWHLENMFRVPEDRKSKA